MALVPVSVACGISRIIPRETICASYTAYARTLDRTHMKAVAERDARDAQAVAVGVLRVALLHGHFAR